MRQLLPLTESEAIFASFQGPLLAEQVRYELVPGAGINFRAEIFWATMAVCWDACELGKTAGALDLPLELPVGEYDELVFSLTYPPEVSVQFLTRCSGGAWEPLGEPTSGSLSRLEIRRPVPVGGCDSLRMQACARSATAQAIQLSWFALRNATLAQLVARNRVRWAADWEGLIKPESEWGALTPKVGLLRAAGDIDRLREKKSCEGWAGHFARLEAAAQKALARAPERELEISDFAPFSDERFVRETERGRAPLYYDALRLAVVGLVNDDRGMILHSLRYLMTMLHLRSWSSSAEMRLPGSGWDQRCFVEEMMSTSVALLLDWFDEALTDNARKVGSRLLWDIGLAVIERDMARSADVHSINQGAWFCRARILGGLYLEELWPAFDPEYADRAATQMRQIMDRYLEPDGGMAEGPMYLLLTLEVVLPPLMAYAARRKVDLESLLPAALPKVPDYFRTVASSVPGCHIPDSDCVGDYPTTDTHPILARLFPGSVYDAFVADSLLSDRPFSYAQHYVGTGIFSFLLGPDVVPEPRCAAATFSLLPSSGLTSSYRVDGTKSLRLLFAGSTALPSHSHADKGGFCAEVDGVPIFIDRGVLRYDDARHVLLKRTENHNTLAPSFDGLTTVEQTLPTVPLIPDANGDASGFSARLELTPVWSGSMLSCTRSIHSDNLDGWQIKDEGELAREGVLVFFLQSRLPFHGEKGRWTCGPIGIRAEWAERGDASDHLIDSTNRPIYRLRLWSQKLIAFSLLTSFFRTP